VIPAFNEEGTIAAVVAGASQHGTVIVVNDGSSDATAALAQSAGAIVVTNERSLGYDGAIDRGFLEAHRLGARIVLTMDADGQHRADLIPGFIERLGANADVVSGVRDRKQRASEHVFALLTRVFFGLRDPLCGMKAYRIDVYRALGHFDSYRSIGTELLLFAACSGRKIAQIAVPTRPRVGSPRFGSGLRANLRIFKALSGFLRRAIFGFQVDPTGMGVP
jgi:glycosyltransferase involved in cell wall biosynthesis